MLPLVATAGVNDFNRPEVPFNEIIDYSFLQLASFCTFLQFFALQLELVKNCAHHLKPCPNAFMQLWSTFCNLKTLGNFG